MIMQAAIRQYAAIENNALVLIYTLRVRHIWGISVTVILLYF